MKYYMSMSGKGNIEIAETLAIKQKSCVYRMNNKSGDFMAQIEVVIPYGECGYVCDNIADGLIDISFVDRKDVDAVLNRLEELGFRGLVAIQHDGEFCQAKGFDSDYFASVFIGEMEFQLEIEGKDNIEILKKVVGNRCYAVVNGIGQIEIFDSDFAVFMYISKRNVFNAIRYLLSKGIRGDILLCHCEAWCDEWWYEKDYEVGLVLSEGKWRRKE